MNFSLLINFTTSQVHGKVCYIFFGKVPAYSEDSVVSHIYHKFNGSLPVNFVLKIFQPIEKLPVQCQWSDLMM